MMPKIKLNSADLHEIRNAMTGLSGAAAKAEAMRLADQHGCHWSIIYAATKDLRPRRKKRTDSGKRRVDLKAHAGMSLATSQVVAHNLNPELALELARASGHETPISLGTYRRYLNQDGLNRGQLRTSRVVHRRFEATAPGQIFQMDFTGLKERWVDTKTRRLLHVSEAEVNRNHPNRNPRRQRVWAAVMVDDYARFLYFQFLAADKLNSSDVIKFELACFREMGVPLRLYTDNDPIIVSQWNRRAASILDRALTDSGGFKLEQHTPGNPNATGKVERTHQLIEEAEKLIGCCDESPTIEELNFFAPQVCLKRNWTEHRTTGMKPAIRFRSGTEVMRQAPPEILTAAFTARDIDAVKVNSDVTINVDGIRWQLPREPHVGLSLRGAKQIPNPFVELAARGKSMKVVWTREADWFLAIVGEDEFELSKVEAVADSADEYKSVVMSAAENNKNHFKGVAAEVRKAARAARKAGEPSPIVVPGVHVPFEIAAQQRPAMFPRKEVTLDLSEWAAHAGQPSIVSERPLTLVAAARLLADEEVFELNDAGQVAQADMNWLRSLFANRDQVNESEIRTAVAGRDARVMLAEVKSA